jgi:metal-responsive CopG/Arc/MetJ family transcriptional regulator
MMSNTIVTATTTDMTVKLGITLSKSILEKIDQTRADIPRSRYIWRAVEKYLRSSSKDIDNNEQLQHSSSQKEEEGK